MPWMRPRPIMEMSRVRLLKDWTTRPSVMRPARILAWTCMRVERRFSEPPERPFWRRYSMHSERCWGLKAGVIGRAWVLVFRDLARNYIGRLGGLVQVSGAEFTDFGAGGRATGRAP